MVKPEPKSYDLDATIPVNQERICEIVDGALLRFVQKYSHKWFSDLLGNTFYFAKV